ncbi:DUF417 family protein [Sphingomonas montana]|uniref:DUF417 family protein n=1 Tax=Sphingomonas montana TaxID=1843236 RepID=UPI0009F8372E|nr:DUF417 family protein [Sphingomonas montana]
MSVSMSSQPAAPSISRSVRRVGRAIALIGIILPLLLIGLNKFQPFEVALLKPLIGGTPWLAWMLGIFGDVGTARLLGVVEIMTAFLLVVSPWSKRAALAAGVLASGTFAVTCSTLLALPIWEPSAGGFPYLTFAGTFLIKDVALLGIGLVVLGEALDRNDIGTR